MFSSRVPGELQPNRFARAVARAREAQRTLIDLTVTNPTGAGIPYPPSMLDCLADAAAIRYEPRPFGLMTAREAVSADYARRGLCVPAEQIVLTASTSEAYSLLFKLLCESGDEVLVPVPSYPLFEHLTRLDGIRATPYRLGYHGRWLVELDTVDAAWSARVRALLAVSPNNPTGSTLSTDELGALVGRCARRDAALILDEVFADYSLAGEGEAVAVLADCLCFRLGGLSKSAGLPQVKLGWIAVQGPARLVAAALERLELICDTYLSVSTPVQVGALSLIAAGAAVRAAIAERIRANYATLRALAASYPASEVLHADAGWSAVVRVPSTRPEEELVLELLERDGVMVHPGFYFDLPHEAFVVVSLLVEPAAFREGIRRLLERADA